jgi:hypothetical protein
MFQQVAEKWVRALRSDEFPQADGTLRSTRGYCCLGVLCELYRREHPDRAEWQTPVDNSPVFPFRMNNGWKGAPVIHDGYLPEPVMEWAGMASSNGRITTTGANLANMNDSGASFAGIAEVISTYEREL